MRCKNTFKSSPVIVDQSKTRVSKDAVANKVLPSKKKVHVDRTKIISNEFTCLKRKYNRQRYFHDH